MQRAELLARAQRSGGEGGAAWRSGVNGGFWAGAQQPVGGG